MLMYDIKHNITKFHLVLSELFGLLTYEAIYNLLFVKSLKKVLIFYAYEFKCFLTIIVQYSKLQFNYEHLLHC